MDDFLQGLQIGGSLAAQAMSNSARLQELKSKQALQRLEEQHVAAQTELLVGQVKKLQEANLQDKVWDAQLVAGEQNSRLHSSLLQQFGVPGEIADQEAIRSTLTHLTALGHPKAEKALHTIATVENYRALIRERDARAEERRNQLPLGQVVELPGTQGGKGVITGPHSMSVIRPENGKSFAPPELERIFEAADAEGAPFSADAKKLAREVHLGIKPRELGVRPEMTRHAYITKMLPALQKSEPKKNVTVPGVIWGTNVVKQPMTEDDMIGALGKQYDVIYGGAQGATQSTPRSTPAPSSDKQNFKKGEKVRQGGVLYEWDGSKMVPVR